MVLEATDPFGSDERLFVLQSSLVLAARDVPTRHPWLRPCEIFGVDLRRRIKFERVYRF